MKRKKRGHTKNISMPVQKVNFHEEPPPPPGVMKDITRNSYNNFVSLAPTRKRYTRIYDKMNTPGKLYCKEFAILSVALQSREEVNCSIHHMSEHKKTKRKRKRKKRGRRYS
jgi:hypothetical protein